MAKVFLILAALNALVAVVCGAFGAHVLKGKLPDPMLAVFRTGTDYQMYHALALFGVGILLLQLSSMPTKWFEWSGWLWVFGIIFFSGSLYWLALGGPRWLGPITPLGGLLLIGAWLSLAIGAWQLRL